MSVLNGEFNAEDSAVLSYFKTYEFHRKEKSAYIFPSRNFTDQVLEKISQSISKKSENILIERLKNKWVHWQKSQDKESDPTQNLKQYDKYCAYLNSFFSPKKNVLADTDLIVASDRFNDPLPLNFIKKSEFFTVCDLYRKIENNETIFKIRGSDRFKHRILIDIRQILARPTGRRLILDLLSHSQGQKIYICPAKEIQVGLPREKDFPIFIDIRPDTQPLIMVEDSRGERFLQIAYLPLAHEMIHVLHYLKGERIAHIELVNDIYPDAEEARTVTGEARVSGQNQIPPFDPINENQIRIEFLLPKRVRYSTISRTFDWDEDISRIDTFLSRNIDLRFNLMGKGFPLEFLGSILLMSIQKKLQALVEHFIRSCRRPFQELMKKEEYRRAIREFEEIWKMDDEGLQRSLALIPTS